MKYKIIKKLEDMVNKTIKDIIDRGSCLTIIIFYDNYIACLVAEPGYEDEVIVKLDPNPDLHALYYSGLIEKYEWDQMEEERKIKEEKEQTEKELKQLAYLKEKYKVKN